MNRAVTALLICTLLYCTCFRAISAGRTGVVELKHYSLAKCAKACLQSRHVSCKYFKFVNATGSCYLSEHNHAGVKAHHHHHVHGTTEGTPDKLLSFLWQKYHLIHARFKQLQDMQHTIQHLQSSKAGHNKDTERHFAKLEGQTADSHKQLTRHASQIAKLLKEGTSLTRALIQLHGIQKDIKAQIEVVRRQGLGKGDKRIIQGNFDRVSGAINALYRQLHIVQHTKQLIVKIASSLQGKFEQVKDRAEHATKGVMKMTKVMSQVDDKIHHLASSLHKVTREAIATRSKLQDLSKLRKKMNIITTYILKIGKIMARQHHDYSYMVSHNNDQMQHLRQQLSKQKILIHHMIVLLKATSQQQVKMAIPNWKNRLAALEKHVTALNSRIHSDEISRHRMYLLLVKVAQQLNHIASEHQPSHGAIHHIAPIHQLSHGAIHHTGSGHQLSHGVGHHIAPIHQLSHGVGHHISSEHQSSHGAIHHIAPGHQLSHGVGHHIASGRQLAHGLVHHLTSNHQSSHGVVHHIASGHQFSHGVGHEGYGGWRRKASVYSGRKRRLRRFRRQTRSLVPREKEQHVEWKRADESTINTDGTNQGMNKLSNMEKPDDAHATHDSVEKSLHRNKRQVIGRPSTIRKSVTSRRVHGKVEQQQSSSNNFLSLLLSKPKGPMSKKQTGFSTTESTIKISTGSMQTKLKSKPSSIDQKSQSNSSRATKTDLKKQHNKGVNGNRRKVSAQSKQMSRTKHMKKQHNKGVNGNRRKISAQSKQMSTTRHMKKQHNKGVNGNRRKISAQSKQMSTTRHMKKQHNKGVNGNRRKISAQSKQMSTTRHMKKQHNKGVNGNRRKVSAHSKQTSTTKHLKGVHENRRNFNMLPRQTSKRKHFKKQPNNKIHGNRRMYRTQSKRTSTASTPTISTTMVSTNPHISSNGSNTSTLKLNVSLSTQQSTVTNASAANTTAAHNQTAGSETTTTTMQQLQTTAESKRYWSNDNGYTDCPGGFAAAHAKKMYCFLTASAYMSYNKASSYCQNKSGILVSVESADKQNALNTTLSGSGFGKDELVWLSPTTTANLWVWQSNMYPIKYLNFQTDTVSRLHQCNVFNMMNGKWQNVSCNSVVRNSTITTSNEHRVICEPYVAEMKAANVEKAGQMSIQDQKRLLETTTTTTTAASVIRKVLNFFGGKRSVYADPNEDY